MNANRIKEITNRLRMLAETSMSDGKEVTASLLIGDANYIDDECYKENTNTDLVQSLEKKVSELKSAINGGGSVTTSELMVWIADRLIEHHKEPKGIDYILSLKHRAQILHDVLK